MRYSLSGYMTLLGGRLPPTWVWLSSGPPHGAAGSGFATLWKEEELEIVFEMFSLIFFNAQKHFHSHMGLVEGDKEKTGHKFRGLGRAQGGSLSALSIALQFISIFLEFLCKALCLISPLVGVLEEMWLPGSLGFQTRLGRQLCPCSV